MDAKRSKMIIVDQFITLIDGCRIDKTDIKSQVEAVHKVTKEVKKGITHDGYNHKSERCPCSPAGEHALTICHPAIYKYLQKLIKDGRMCFFNLIEKQYRERILSHRISKLTTCLISNISRRRTKKLLIAMALPRFRWGPV